MYAKRVYLGAETLPFHCGDHDPSPYRLIWSVQYHIDGHGRYNTRMRTTSMRSRKTPARRTVEGAPLRWSAGVGTEGRNSRRKRPRRVCSLTVENISTTTPAVRPSSIESSRFFERGAVCPPAWPPHNTGCSYQDG